MRNRYKMMFALVMAAVMALVLSPGAVAAPKAWECNTGNVCFYTGPDGTGSRCMWDVADPDWATGGTTCS